MSFTYVKYYTFTMGLFWQFYINLSPMLPVTNWKSKDHTESDNKTIIVTLEKE